MQPFSPAPATSRRDERLWQVAKARTKFQGHLLVYLLVNIGLWVLWALTDGHHDNSSLPWPAWTSSVWGLAVAWQGFCAYGRLNRGERTQREYERLLSQQQ